MHNLAQFFAVWCNLLRKHETYLYYLQDIISDMRQKFQVTDVVRRIQKYVWSRVII